MTKVLVVDDDLDNTANLADILSDLGYDVVTSNDPEAALRLVSEQRFDVALLDYKMPGMNGADLYAQIKKEQPHTVAIMVTAYAGSNGVERAKDVGTWKVLRKPVEIAQLVELLDDATRQPVILIVDDDQEFCENLWQILRNRDLRVAFAHEETTAVSQLRANPFQVILLDLQLGRDTAGNVFQTVSELGLVARTIIVTGNRSSCGDVLTGMLQSGAPAVHFKPFEVAELIESIDVALHQGDSPQR